MAARPRHAAPTGAAACRLQAARDFARAFFLLPVLAENPPDHRRPFGFDRKYPVPHGIAQQRAAEHHALLHAARLPPLDARRGAAALLLRDRAHDGQPQLGVRVPRVDAVAQEQYAHAELLQLARIRDRIQDIARKAADLLGQKQGETARTRVGHHTVERRAPLCRGAGHAFVRIDSVQRPVGLAADKRLEIPLLAGKGARLVLLVRGHAAIGRGPYHGRASRPAARSFKRRRSSRSARGYAAASSRPQASASASSARPQASQKRGPAGRVRSPFITGCLYIPSPPLSGGYAPPPRRFPLPAQPDVVCAAEIC